MCVCVWIWCCSEGSISAATHGPTTVLANVSPSVNVSDPQGKLGHLE